MTISKRYVRILDNEKKDNAGTIEALRMQCKAWRLCAIIATADTERGIRETRWLLYNTLPYVNAPLIEKYIAEREDEAAKLGEQSGVFMSRA